MAGMRDECLMYRYDQGFVKENMEFGYGKIDSCL